MAVERSSSGEEKLGSLRGCLVEGDPEQRKRERSVRRRALLVSVLLQVTALVALVLIPLFAKPERIVFAIATPIPPYHHVSQQRDTVEQQARNRRGVCIHCFNLRPVDPALIGRTDSRTELSGPSEGIDTGGPSVPCPSCIDIGRTEGPRAPIPAEPVVKRVSLARVDPAMLIHRVEPIYPTLMRQIRRTGRVELRAVIATDGSIQSLRVVSGDPGFYQSALDAVGQWRYRPTVLNGNPVEVDTFITVIYSMPQ
jgi:periplasmic protein TonB